MDTGLYAEAGLNSVIFCVEFRVGFRITITGYARTHARTDMHARTDTHTHAHTR